MEHISETTKLTLACERCRKRKVRCNGTTPCKHCLRHNSQCLYPPSRRGKRARSNHPNAQSLSPSREATASSSIAPSTDACNVPTLLAVPNLSPAMERDGTRHGSVTTSTNLIAPSRASLDLVSPEFTQHSGDLATRDALNEAHQTADGEDNVIPLHKIHWEHHGPWSWASICSPPGVRWVSDRTACTEFGDIATDLTKAWSRRLKLMRARTVAQKSTEPDEPTAWKYISAYFEQCYEAVFGIVNRHSFEMRMHSYFSENALEQEEDDYEFYALRNAIYALGSRALLANDPLMGFVQAQNEAARFFGNAMSVFSELVFGFSGLAAVQALALMAFFAEGIGSPALEYPLCANAVQLAQAKGLHREPSKSWKLADADVSSRKWLWWAIYCLEKQIAFRSGRPSLIDDNNISATIPTENCAGNAAEVEMATLIIRHSQISSQISSQLMSVNAFRQPLAATFSTVDSIHGQLLHLLSLVPTNMRIGGTSRAERRPAARLTQALHLHFALYGSLMAIHTLFFYPWILGRFAGDIDSSLQTKISKSSDTVSLAAREILGVLHSLNVDATTPVWHAFYYPMYAHINLFLHTLRFPCKATASSDLALLDICAGHFGHLEHMTSSQIVFHFPRDSAAIAARFVKKHKDEEANSSFVTRKCSPSNMVTANDTDHNFGDCSGLNTMLMDDSFAAMDFDGGWDIFSIEVDDELDAQFESFLK